MKHLKKISLLLVIVAFMTSCEKERETLTVGETTVQAQKKLITKTDKLQSYFDRLIALQKNKTTSAKTENLLVYKGELCSEKIESEFEDYTPYLDWEEDSFNALPHFYSFEGNEGDEISIYIPRKVEKLDLAFTFSFGIYGSIEDYLEDYNSDEDSDFQWYDDEVESEYGGCYEDPMLSDYTLPYTGTYTVAVLMLSGCEWDDEYYLGEGEDENEEYDEEQYAADTDGYRYRYEIIPTGISSCDTDNDGVLNEDDPYPNSNMSDYLSFGEDELDIENQFSSEGTTMMDEVDDLIARLNEQYNGSNSYALSREFKNEMAKITYYWYKSRLISRRDRVNISRAVATVSFPFGDEPG